MSAGSPAKTTSRCAVRTLSKSRTGSTSCARLFSHLAISLACAVPASAQVPLDPFYTQHLDAAGIPVSGSALVPEAALANARAIILDMLAHRPDLARWL